jgi:AraC-like DNA-binding protein
MTANPTFGLYTELPVDTISATQWQGYECTMCRGTGKVLNAMPNLRAGHPGNVGRASINLRRPLDSIVVSLASCGKTSQRAGFPRYMIRRIEELVGKHLEGGVGITEMSSRLGYSPSHFFRMFRRSFGITPHTYVMRRRVAIAQQLLTRTDLGLVDIALKAGFCDQSHLSRSFRRVAGLPPRAYRALLRTFPDGDTTVAATESGSLGP